MTETDHQKRLRSVHEIRMRRHWGKNAPIGAWPETPAEWRQATHGAPWDANVTMAEWHLGIAKELRDADLLDD